MSETSTRMETYALLGMFFDRQLQEEGLRKPDETQLQFFQSNWRLWGGEEYPEPKEITAGAAYLIACESPGIDEQQVIDATFEQVKSLRAKSLRAKGKAKKIVDEQLNKLRDELEEARKFKSARLAGL